MAVASAIAAVDGGGRSGIRRCGGAEMVNWGYDFGLGLKIVSWTNRVCKCFGVEKLEWYLRSESTTKIFCGGVVFRVRSDSMELCCRHCSRLLLFKTNDNPS